MVVTMDEVEVNSAAYSALLIYKMSEQRGLRERMVTPKLSPLYIVQVGQIAERAVAKALDLYWSGAANTFSKPDLSHNVEVRATRRRGQGVKVRPRDHDDKRVVGVLVEEGKEKDGTYPILGWCRAGDVKQARWERRYYGGPPYYEVPLSELRPIEELKQIIKGE